MSEFATREKVTLDEFFAMPETNQLTELINGEIFVSPAPSLDHQYIVGSFYSCLKKIAPNGRVLMSPTDVLLGENVAQPDVFWIPPESQSRPAQNQYYEGAPELIIEVLSPSSLGAQGQERQICAIRTIWRAGILDCGTGKTIY